MHTSPDVLALLAVGEVVGSSEERTHIEHCPVCRAEVEELAHVVDVGRRSGPDDPGLIPPRPEVWTAIRTELGLTSETAALDEQTTAAAGQLPVDEEATTPPPTTPSRSTSVEPGRRRPHRVLSMALAAALALVAGIGIGVGVDRFAASRQTVVAEARLESLPGWSGSTGTAVVQRDDQGNRELVVRLESPQPVDGRRQVWLLDPQTSGLTVMGYLRSDNTGHWPIPDNVDLRRFDVVDVSDEPADDGNPAHSGVSVVRGTLST